VDDMVILGTKMRQHSSFPKSSQLFFCEHRRSFCVIVIPKTFNRGWSGRENRMGGFPRFEFPALRAKLSPAESCELKGNWFLGLGGMGRTSHCGWGLD